MIDNVAAVTVRPIASFGRGFSYPFRAAKFLLKRPGLLKYLAVPFSINLLIFSLAVYFGVDLFDGLLGQYLPAGEQWYWVVLNYLAWIVAFLLTAVLVFFSFTVVGNLIASPFNELLSERTEEVIFGHASAQSFSLGRFWSEARHAMGVELKKQLFFILGMIFLFMLNLVPALGAPVYAVLAPLFTLFFLVVEYLGFVLMRKQISFSRQQGYVLKKPILMLGFGCGVFCLLAIPLLQFFCIPLAVVGATMLWCDFPLPENGSGGE